MSKRDLKSNIDYAQSITPGQYTAAVSGVGVDLTNYKSAVLLVLAGASGGTTPSFTFEVQESDDNVTFAAAPNSSLQGVEPVITAGSEAHRIGYIGSKRYIRAAITAVTGTGPTLQCCAGVVRGDPFLGPL